MRKTGTILLLVAAAGGFGAAGWQNEALVRFRAAHRMDATEPLRSAPPVLAFTTVILGGFRGLIADLFWLRASYLQDEGRYMELVQLSDWITKLEPRNTEVWSYHAWNMAYNVSAMMSDPEEKWRWVQNGIRLLRDEGLDCNPGDPQLYWNLGWMFQHKIGASADSAHEFYKAKWAAEMAALFEGERPDYAALASQPEKARVLRETYRLAPETMQAIERDYGRLDWRVGDAHAVYWACRGRQAAGDKGSLPCERMLYQSLADLFRRGRSVPAFRAGSPVVEPDISLLPGALRAYDEALRRFPDETVASAYLNFLCDAVLVLHRTGHANEAKKAFEILRLRFPTATRGQGFDVFVSTFKGPP